MERRLYKSTNDKVVSGVCGGIGEYFQVDPVLIRVVAVISIFFGGAGLIAYIIAAIIIPTREEAASRKNDEPVYKRNYESNAQDVNYQEAKAEASSSSTSNASYESESEQQGQSQTQSSASQQKWDETATGNSETNKKTNRDMRMALGLGLVGLGVFFILRQFIYWLNFSFVIAFVLIIIGIYLIIRRNGESK